MADHLPSHPRRPNHRSRARELVVHEQPAPAVLVGASLPGAGAGAGAVSATTSAWPRPLVAPMLPLWWVTSTTPPNARGR